MHILTASTAAEVSRGSVRNPEPPRFLMHLSGLILIRLELYWQRRRIKLGFLFGYSISPYPISGDTAPKSRPFAIL